MNKNYDLAVGAKRLEKVTPSLIRTILDRASVLRSEGKPVIPFSAGEPDFNTPSDIKEAAIRAITNNQSKYTSNRGYPALRKVLPKAKHGKGAAQSGRHTHSGSCAQRATPLWKQVLLTLLVLVALLALLGGALWQNICYNRTHYTAEFYQIHSRKLTQSCRVVFLTDLHLREYGADNCELVQDVRSLAPDLILLGGDFVTYGEGTDYDNMLSLFRQLSEIAPVCGVLGNHEDELYFLDNDRELVEKFTAAGVTVLRNQEARYTIHDNVISILGVEGSPADFSNYGASTFMDSVEPQTDYDLRICLAHVPTYFTEHLENYSFELGLAGHTHGGIVRLPKIGPLYTAEEGFLPDYAGGSYTLANNATLIVSRGLGDSSRAPRINNVPELSVIDID